jgi:hypothetical protein
VRGSASIQLIIQSKKVIPLTPPQPYPSRGRELKEGIALIP